MSNSILELEEALSKVSYSGYNLDFIKHFLIDNYLDNDITRIYIVPDEDGKNIFAIEYCLIIKLLSHDFRINVLVYLPILFPDNSPEFYIKAISKYLGINKLYEGKINSDNLRINLKYFKEFDKIKVNIPEIIDNLIINFNKAFPIYKSEKENSKIFGKCFLDYSKALPKNNKSEINQDIKDDKLNILGNIDNNFDYVEQINELKKQLEEERKKNKFLTKENMKLNDIIFNLKSKISKNENYDNKVKSLKVDIQKQQLNFDISKIQNDYSITSIKSGEKMMTVNFTSMGIQDIDHYSLACRKADLFVRLEEKLINDFPALSENDLYFQVNVRRIKRYKTLEENNIKK